MGVDNSALNLPGATTTEPAFSTVFRGYDKREVDQYAHLVESHLAASVAERQEQQGRIRALTDELHRAHLELVELRRRPAIDEQLSFRHLGARVEQILTQAEEQAQAIRDAAAELLDKERAKLQAELGGAREAREQALRECEHEITMRRDAFEREIARQRSDAAVELEEAKAQSARARAEAEAILRAAREDSKRLRESAAAAAERMRNDALAYGTAVRLKAEQDAAALAASAETYAQQTREAAEEHARETRNAAEHRARQVTEAAELAASQLRTQAEQHAVRVRAAAESHAARLHAAAQQEFLNGAGELRLVPTLAGAPPLPASALAAAGGRPGPDGAGPSGRGEVGAEESSPPAVVMPGSEPEGLTQPA